MKAFAAIGLLLVAALAALSLTTPSLVRAADGAPPPAAIAAGAAAGAGQACASCHSPDDARLAQPAVWDGAIEREALRPCPALARIHEERYYTERLLLAITRSRGEAKTSPVDARLVAGREAYARLLDAPVVSAAAFTAEAQAARYELGKVYAELTQRERQVRQAYVIGAAGLVSLVLSLTFAWGWRTTRRYLPAGTAARPRPTLRAGLLVGLVFVVFALPVFRTPAPAVADVAAEEQAAETALTAAERQAAASERALMRAWMLARIGAAWADLDPARANTLLDEALAAAAAAQANTEALWGAAQSAREAVIGVPAQAGEAELMAAALDAVRQRSWALRLIATEWLGVDAARSEQILSLALDVTLARAPGLYRDLDLRGLAAAWARVDADRATQVAGEIGDPALRAWALREIAADTGQPALYALAAEAARSVTDPSGRAMALGAIAEASGQSALFAEASVALEAATGAARAYGLSDLAARAGDARLAERIDPAFPAARAAAWLRLGAYQPAWDAALLITDPMERDRALAAIAGAWRQAVPAQQIADPVLRDWASREVILKTGDPSLADGLEMPYFRVSALSQLGHYAAAADAAATLAEPYPLVALASGWAGTDAAAALAIVDDLEREADKAAALRAIAVLVDDPAVFDRALSLALAARVRGSPLSAAEASLALASAFIETDPARAERALTQAYQIASGLSIK